MSVKTVVEPVTICLACGSQMIASYEEMVHNRNGLMVVISNVPMSVCRQCGERYVPGPIAVALSDLVDRTIKNFEREQDAAPVARPRRVEYEANKDFAGAFATV